MKQTDSKDFVISFISSIKQEMSDRLEKFVLDTFDYEEFNNYINYKILLGKKDSEAGYEYDHGFSAIVIKKNNVIEKLFSVSFNDWFSNKNFYSSDNYLDLKEKEWSNKYYLIDSFYSESISESSVMNDSFLNFFIKSIKTI